MADATVPGQDKVEEAFDRAARWLHGKGDFTPEMMKEAPVRSLINETVIAINNGISLGVGNKQVSDKLAEGLRNSTYMFSGFKSFHEMKEAASLLVDENGNRKPFNQYLNDVQKINSTYNARYLKAEYEFASASAQMAAKWDELSEDADRYNLQYRTAGDDRVRKSHEDLNGITLPADDPFWDHYLPPNGFSCRCVAVKVRKSKYAASDSKEAIEKGKDATAGKHQEMFRFNPGKQRAAYPAYNSYTIAKCDTCSKEGFKLAKVPNNELCQACGIIKEMKCEKEKLKKQRDEIKEKAKFLKERTLKNEQFGKDIRVSSTNIKEWLNQPHKWIVDKNKMLLDIEKVISKAPYLGCGPDKHDPDITMHLFETTLHDEKSWIIVRELIDGSIKLHSISDNEGILQFITKRKE